MKHKETKPVEVNFPAPLVFPAAHSLTIPLAGENVSINLYQRKHLPVSAGLVLYFHSTFVPLQTAQGSCIHRHRMGRGLTGGCCWKNDAAGAMAMSMVVK